MTTEEKILQHLSLINHQLVQLNQSLSINISLLHTIVLREPSVSQKEEIAVSNILRDTTDFLNRSSQASTSARTILEMLDND
jgi:hypothetical protein